MATRKSKSATQAAAETVAAEAIPETVQVQATEGQQVPAAAAGQVQVMAGEPRPVLTIGASLPGSSPATA